MPTTTSLLAFLAQGLRVAASFNILFSKVLMKHRQFLQTLTVISTALGQAVRAPTNKEFERMLHSLPTAALIRLRRPDNTKVNVVELRKQQRHPVHSDHKPASRAEARYLIGHPTSRIGTKSVVDAISAKSPKPKTPKSKSARRSWWEAISRRSR